MSLHETILLVEDEPAIRDLMRVSLEREGYHVVEARHGKEALSIVDRLDPDIDLLLVDMRLPHVGGETVIERLRQRQPGVKVLSISGFPGHAPVDLRIPFLQKPFTRHQLLAAVREVLDRRPPRTLG